MRSRLRSTVAAACSSAVLCGAARADANPGTPYTGPVPAEVKAHLAHLDRFPAADYFKFTPAALLDLNGDGTPELVVDGGIDAGGNTAWGIYERRGSRYVVIGELLCERAGFSVEKGASDWQTFVCGDGTRVAFDDEHHRYGVLSAQAKARKVAAKKRKSR